MAPDMSHLRVSAGGVSMELMSLIQKLDIPVHLSCKLEEVTDNTVVCRNMNTSERVEFPADTVLLALGMSARHSVADSLRHSAPETEVYIVGDALEVGTIATAIRSAFKAAAYV
jgi:NADH dehydrogenase FAD-containing subunit